MMCNLTVKNKLNNKFENSKRFAAGKLKCMTWNINNFYSKVFGNKLENKDFIELVNDCDILSLVETHSKGDDLFIPGFGKPFQLLREGHKNKKSFGGIAVFIKKELLHNNVISRVETQNKDVLWIKLHGNKIGEANDLFIGTVYLSPGNKRNKSATERYISNLESDIEHFAKFGKIALQGDFNARTGSVDDFINLSDNDFCYDNVFCFEDYGLGHNQADTEENSTFFTKRNSQDPFLCKRGRELLAACKNHNLCILNGRKVGDLFGKITCFRWNGCSVIDYAICSRDLLKDIINFKVLTSLPWISDHAPIVFELSLHRSLPNETTEKSNLEELPKSFFWDEKSKEHFRTYLKSNNFQNLLETVDQKLSCENTDTSEILNDFYTLLNDAASEAKVKFYRYIGKPKQPHQKWFDNECKKAKNDLNLAAKKMSANPKNSLIRLIVNTKRRAYKSLVRKRKANYIKENLDLLAQQSRQPKKFWNKLNSLRNLKKSNHGDEFSPENLLKYFSSLLWTHREQIITEVDTHINDLDRTILRKEIDAALKQCKSSKSSGLDGINKEMICAFYESHPFFLTKFFNFVLDKGSFPNAWSVSLMVLIHKKGPKSELENYRGISLLSSLSKVFCAIINNRLVEWGTGNNLFSMSQFGFMKGNRTSDALNILHNLIDLYCHKRNSKFYSCFVDFEKAFDRVPRDILLQKLKKLGLGGKIFNVIKSMYSGDSARIKLGDKMTNPIKINQGVRQGCVLSPTLFNLFLCDFESFCANRRNCDPVEIDKSTKISCIIWADDILLLSETKSGLQSQLESLHLYSITNLLSVNLKKTKCMCFNRKGTFIRSNLHLNGTHLEDVNEILYLGFLVRCNGNVLHGLKNLRERASKAFFKIKYALGHQLFNNPFLSFKIFDCIIKPILLYASDFWGLYSINSKGNGPCDNLHNRFCKWLLGVSKRTSDMGVLFDLGRYPISIEGQIRCFDNWIRILGNKSCNELLTKSCKNAQAEICRSFELLTNFLKHVGLSSLAAKIHQLVPKGKITRTIKEYLCKEFALKCKHSFTGLNSKLTLLSTIKKYWGRAEYINSPNVVIRAQIAKFRLSDHDLEIEKGRYARVPKPERICKLCRESVEDESHFLLSCNGYTDQRNILITNMENLMPGFSGLDNSDKLRYILNPEVNAIKVVANFLHMSLVIRTSKLSQLDH